MIQTENNSSIFNLTIDENAKYNLKEIAKWAKFLGIIGFVGLGIMILASIAMVTMASQLNGLTGVGIALIYVVLAIVYVYPVLNLFNFGKQMKLAMLNNDQLLMNKAFTKLKNCFQYIGIITIIILVLYGVVAIFGLIFAASKF